MSATKTLLLIDDDEDLRGALKEQFELYDAYSIKEADTAGEGMNIAKEGRIDLILLDVDLPDMDGRDACKLMRRDGVRAPIVMLTGQTTDADAILGLDSGANDYVTKPFKFSVLLARVRAHLRSFEQSEDAIFQVGPYEFRPSAKLLTDSNGRKIRLTEKETNILKYLYRSSGKPVGREELLSEVWGYNSNVTTHTLETHVYRLRQKIEPDPANSKLLLTETGGYRLQV
ncbi:MAG: DNA-binding response regulator [Ponticaulis sp.]|nr:DNA-binding response regulator [Ponticaulis sp.]